MDDDTSDILGGPTLPIVRGNKSGSFSSLSVLLTIPVALFLFVVGAQIWERFQIWREKSYKLAMRRRHGIPDNDHRPFNVAYAAVVRARQEEEAATRRAKLDRLLGDDQRVAQPNQAVRQNQGGLQKVNGRRPMAIPGRFDFSGDNFAFSSSVVSQHPSVHPSFQDRYNPNSLAPAAEPELEVVVPKAGPSRRGNRKMLVDDSTGRAKAAAGQEDEVVEWEHEKPRMKRGSKRVFLDDEEDEFEPSKKNREKRLRKVSLEKTPQHVDVYMDVDEEDDEVPELGLSIRGKKRDRAEAGSTFGGDDDDSAQESEAEDYKARRHRKRRTYVKRKSDVGLSSRGQKRDRDVEEDDESVESEDGSFQNSRKKRGKRSAHASEEIEDDVSMDDSPAPSGRRKRRIGEEWESNGVSYKIGPNGQRLRQTLVKKERQKFPMPMDSQHPDRQANLEVCVEVWLTEAEYHEAKEQMHLAWQDTNKMPAASETTADTQGSPVPPPTSGKDLLWQSTTATTTGTSTPTRITPPTSPPLKSGRDLQRLPAVSNAGLRVSTFPNQAPGKRIASMARVSSAWTGASIHPGTPASPVLTESTRGSPRGIHLSKWEKQDLEAKAMMRMREANRKREEEKAQKLKEEQDRAEREKKEKEAAAAARTIPTITLTAPQDKPAQAETKPQGFAFGPTPTAAAEPPKAAPAAPSPLFPTLGGQPQPAAASSAPKPSPLFPAPTETSAFPPAAQVKPEAKPSSFNFAAPSTSAAPAPSAAPTASPFSFGAPASQPPKEEEKKATPSAGTGTLFGAPILNKPSQASANAQSGQNPFNFGKANVEAPKPASPFAVPQNAAQGSATTGTTTAPSAGLKFSFAKPTPPAAGAADAKPATTSPFVFNAPSGNINTGAGAASAGATAPKLSFGFTAGTTQTASKPSTAPPSGGAAPVSAFASFGAAPAASNSTPAGTTKPAFNFGAPSSAANPAPTTNGIAAPAASPFSFTGASTAVPSAPTNGEAARPTFSNFGATSKPAPTPASEPSKPVFSFGATSSTPAASATTNGDAKPFTGFGAATNGTAPKSAFGQTTSFGMGSGSTFGGASAPTTKPSEETKPSAFSFVAPPAATNGGNGSSKLPFGFGNASTTPASTSGPSAFGFTSATPQTSSNQPVFGGSSGGSSGFSFGAPTGGAFAFGKTAPATGEKQQ